MTIYLHFYYSNMIHQSIILLSYWNILLFSPSRRVLTDHAVKVRSSIVIGLSIFLLILTALLLYSTIMIQLYYCVYINILLHLIHSTRRFTGSYMYLLINMSLYSVLLGVTFTPLRQTQYILSQPLKLNVDILYSKDSFCVKTCMVYSTYY